MNPFKNPFNSPVSALETSRLRIRIDSEESYVAKFQNSTDTELMDWCGFAAPEELEQQKLKVEGGLGNYRTSNVFFHLIETASERVIGAVVLHTWYQIHRRSELGYAMTSEAHKGQGYMKEALREILKFGFEAMDLNRVEAYTAPDNIASRRLLEGAGFQLEGQLREHYAHKGATSDSVVYGLLRSEWES